MRKGWTEVTLDEVAIASWGNTTTTKLKYVPSGYLAYSASGADGYLDWFEHDCNGVILSAIGAQCGKTWFAHGKWTPIKNTIWIKGLKDKLLDQYLYYLSNRDQFWQIRGQAQPFISLGDVRTTTFLLPPLQEQKRIVDLISSVDSYIDALQHQAESARKFRDAVLHEMLSAGGDGWIETTLGEICKDSLFGDGDWVESKDQDPAGTNRLLQLADIGDGMFLNKSNRWINDEQFKRLSCTKLQHNDLLIARMPDPISRACLLPEDLPISATVVDVAIVRTGDDELQKMLVLIINERKFRAAATSLLTGTTRQRISRSNLAKIEFWLPPLPEQIRIVDLISSMDEAITTTEVTIAETKKLRSGLLSDLLSGDHEIPASYDKIMGVA
jgi:restriction endonuclease S subunit